MTKITLGKYTILAQEVPYMLELLIKQIKIGDFEIPSFCCPVHLNFKTEEELTRHIELSAKGSIIRAKETLENINK